MKAAATLITLVILVIIIISVGILLWLYLIGYFTQVKQAGETSTTKSLEVLSSCIKIEEAFQNKFFIRNCGSGVINNDTLNVYVDGELNSFDLNPSSIDGGKTGTINLKGIWGISIGTHSLRIVNPNAETSTYFEAQLPDSCVLALDFDEGSGTRTIDFSLYRNDGTLGNGSAWSIPTWVAGKHGEALNFNGSQIVNVSKSNSLNLTKITIEAWIRPIGPTGYDQAIVVKGADVYNLEFESYLNLSFVIRDVGYVIRGIDSDFKISWGVWQHVAVTYDGVNARFYLNGIEDIKSFPYGDINTNPPFEGDICIGCHNYWFFKGGNPSNTIYFNGIIDSVRVYDKALTPDETLNFRII